MGNPLILNILVPEKLSLNKIYAGVHWQKRQEYTDEWHLAVQVSKPKRSTVYVGGFPADCHYHFRLPGMKMDISNHAFMVKLIEDGLVRCGVLPDDTQKTVASITITAEQSDANEVVVTITPCAPH